MLGACRIYELQCENKCCSWCCKNHSQSTLSKTAIKQFCDTNHSYHYTLIFSYIPIHNYVISLKHIN